MDASRNHLNIKDKSILAIVTYYVHDAWEQRTEISAHYNIIIAIIIVMLISC